MNRHFLALALTAGLALPGFGQSLGSSTFSPPYLVRINTASLNEVFPDVVNVYGLPVTHLLSTVYEHLPTPLRTEPNRTSFAFTRQWDGDFALQGLVGNPGSGTDFVHILLNPPPSPLPAPPEESLALGNPDFVEWELYAENGVAIIEASEFLYSTEQVVSTNHGFGPSH